MALHDVVIFFEGRSVWGPPLRRKRRCVARDFELWAVRSRCRGMVGGRQLEAVGGLTSARCWMGSSEL